MAIHVITMPDIGEGIAEAEVSDWLVGVGDIVAEDDPLVDVMTDKATVSIPSPVAGRVVSLGGEVGDVLAVGAELIRLEVGGGEEPAPVAPADHSDPTDGQAAAEPVEAVPVDVPSPQPGPDEVPTTADPDPESPRVDQPSRGARRLPADPGPPRREGDRPLARPSVRARAREAGVDLRFVRGTGPAGHILHEDLDRYLAGAGGAPAVPVVDDGVTEVKVVGLRRRIAERMALSARSIPHITIVEEVDVTAVEELRSRLNTEGSDPKLTMLPFVMKAVTRAVADQPQLNAHFDDAAGVVTHYHGVHLGIATQTDAGLMVPVVRHAETRGLRGLARELARVAEAARTGRADRDELTGSTITITSLGPLGAIATTPIINHPEVAIVGVNKMAVRPVWDGTAFVPRTMMNLSCSFDHRMVDGWDAAVFVQRLKDLLETPALMFVEGDQ